MTKVHSALVVATVALSPSCSTGLSLQPRGPQTAATTQHNKQIGESRGRLFGKRPSGSGSSAWMLPSFRSSKYFPRFQTPKEKEEPFFTDTEGGDDAPKPSAYQEKFLFPSPEDPLHSSDSPPNELLEQLVLNPKIATDVPSDVIQGAAINGSFLTLLTSYLLFGPLSIPSLTTLTAAASVGIVTAYVSITEGVAGDVVRSVGEMTMEVTDKILDWVGSLGGGGTVVDRTIPTKEAAAPKPTKAAAPKKMETANPPVRRDVAKSMPLTEGLTAEEAEEVRVTRLVGSAPVAKSSAPTRVAEGQTAEEAMEARTAREEEIARLAEELMGEEHAAVKEKRRQEEAAAAAKKKREEEEASAARAKSEEEEARLKALAEEEARIRAEEEAAARAAKAEEEARMRAEEEARLKAAAAEEEARIRADEEKARARVEEEEARIRAEEESRALEAEARKMEEARLAKLAEEEEQRRLEEQAEAARAAVRIMEEQEALMEDEDEDEDDELDDEDWEASVRLANELQGTPSPSMGGDVMDEISDEMLQTEINDLSAEEEDALGKAAREAVRKYEEEMATKSSRKEAVKSSWDDEMAVTPGEEEPINGVSTEEAAAPAAAPAEDYSKMTVAQLKDVLRSKGLKVSGKKAELVERLASS